MHVRYRINVKKANLKRFWSLKSNYTRNIIRRGKKGLKTIKNGLWEQRKRNWELGDWVFHSLGI